MISNNHVGNNWSYSISVNNKKLIKGKSIKINSSTLKSTIKIIEHDKSPDIGLKTFTLVKGKENTFNVVVVENKGRYSGNKAVWKIKIKVN
jgi:hypothetical protein